MAEIKQAIDSCNNLISKYQKRLDGADFHRGSTMRSIALERIKIQALEKQNPKKPVWQGDYLCCSCCNTNIMKGTHCHGCGQAIDWSESENVPINGKHHIIKSEGE